MTHRIDRRRLLAGATAATTLLATPPLVRAQAQALKIAVLLPRSGYLAQAGQSCHRGALVAGKVLADHGYRVELVHVDIESSPEISRTQAEKVINEGANCIVGAFDSGCTLAIARVASSGRCRCRSILRRRRRSQAGPSSGAQLPDRRHAGVNGCS